MTTEVTTLATTKVINNALTMIRDPETPMEDKAAMFGLLVELKRRIDKALGTYERKGSTPKFELQAHLATLEGEQLGPLYLGWEAYDVAYPINDAENWTDAQAQSDLQSLPRGFVRAVPAHLEVDVAALGAAVHEGSPTALAVWDFLKSRRYRTEGGKRAVLKVREIKAPKGKKAAA